MKRLLNPSTDNSFAGSRIYPAQNAKKDMKYGVRFDRGQSVTGQPNLVVMNLQINTNPQAKSLKALVRKHTPHRKYVTIKVDTTQAATEENLDKLLDEVESKIDALNDL
ncbi:hypothetical protein N7465_005962 [Penicillium sp. CMV-2018d]|nr:hypothetical protein N7465_005962 [Penicillium sp. CMV-2018d]